MNSHGSLSSDVTTTRGGGVGGGGDGDSVDDGDGDGDKLGSACDESMCTSAVTVITGGEAGTCSVLPSLDPLLTLVR